MGFLLIGLAGGTVKGRESVAATLVDQGGRSLGAYAYGISAEGRLDRSFSRDLARVNNLTKALDDLPKLKRTTPEAGLVITHLAGEDEVAIMRLAGGVIWHLVTPVSASIAIEIGDLLVTPRSGGIGHLYDPLEALSIELVRQQAAKPKKFARA